MLLYKGLCSLVFGLELGQDSFVTAGPLFGFAHPIIIAVMIESLLDFVHFYLYFLQLNFLLPQLCRLLLQGLVFCHEASFYWLCSIPIIRVLLQVHCSFTQTLHLFNYVKACLFEFDCFVLHILYSLISELIFLS